MRKITLAPTAAPNICSQLFSITRNGKLWFLTVSILMTFTLTSCGQSNLYKRWQLAGRIVNGKKDMKIASQEYEFFSSGKFNHYAGGSIIHTGTYTLASDKKSLLLKDGYRDIPMKITKLTASELDLQLGNDTVICYPSSSASGAKAQQKGDAYKTASLDWLDVIYNYDMYHTLGNGVVFDIEQTEHKKDNEICTRYTALVEQAQPYLKGGVGNLTQETFKDFLSLEEKISKALAMLSAYIKEKHPDMPAGYPYDESKRYSVVLEEKITKSESRIKTTNAKFIKSFGEFTK
jgi:hypothetical protein